jgi:soluble lytic murein transglycosylase-like protein
VDPLVVAAIIEQESGGNPAAVSRNGAVGLMQVMPGDGNALSFQCIGGPCFSDRPSTNQLLEPEYNILYVIQILSDFQNKFGDLRETLRAYGPIDMGYAYADHVLELAESYQ